MPDRTQTLSVTEQLRGRLKQISTFMGWDRPDTWKVMEAKWIADTALSLSQPEHQGDDPVERRERAVAELLDLAKVADDEWMRDDLERLASRFSLPPSSQPPAPLSDQEKKTLGQIEKELRHLAREHFNSVVGKRYEGYANFLRNLASREHRGEECPTCGSDDPSLVNATNRKGKPARFVWTDASILSDERRAHWHCPDAFHDSAQPPAGEVERLRERVVEELAYYARAADCCPAAASISHERLAQTREVYKELLAPPSDSQGDQERCGTCGGSGLVPQASSLNPWRDCPDCNPAPTQVEEGCRNPDACEWDWWPDHCSCRSDKGKRHDAPEPQWMVERNKKKEQPEGGDEEDWPEVALWREVGRRGPVHAAPDLVGKPAELRRYAPATSQDSAPKHPGGAAGEGEDAVEAIHRIAIEAELDDLDQTTLAEWASLLTALEAGGWHLVHATSQDSSELEEKLMIARGAEIELAHNLRLEIEKREEAEDRASKAEAERDRWMARCDEAAVDHMQAGIKLGRAETALDGLAALLSRLAKAQDESSARKGAYANAAQLAREKAAELKEGERRG